MPVVFWSASDERPKSRDTRIHMVVGECDPWHLLSGATEVIADADDELVLIAAIAGKSVRCIGTGPFAAAATGEMGLLSLLRGVALGGCAYQNPFTGERMELAAAIELCAFWRRMVDSNRSIRSAIGFASWKRPTVEPLLWPGSAGVPFAANMRDLTSGDEVAVWKSRVPQKQLDHLVEISATLVEVEDGFIRSVGLGADCVPPLSIIVDRVGIYFDPQQASELEDLLEHGSFPAELVARARCLRELVVNAGISKYEVGTSTPGYKVGPRRKLLVVGQVEDDRSVLCGGGPVQSNIELLRRVRQANPDANIVYRPHPDVQAGHRAGGIPADQLSKFADELDQSGSITQSLELADEVHVNTSLAGFEALLRGKPVVTLGVPFYAGWGLTKDLGNVPSRRTAKRSLDELVAAVLLIYPRYLDPETGLPCPAEVLVMRLADGGGNKSKGTLVRLRQFQGRLKNRIAAIQSRVAR